MRLILKSAMVVAVLAPFLFAAPIASAFTCSSIGTGNWDAPATWTTCNGVIPTSTDSVEIRGGFTVTVNVSNGVAQSIQIGGNPGTLGGNLKFNSGSQVTVSGTVTLGGATSTTNGTLNMTSGGTVIAANLALGAGANTKTWTVGTGTVTLTGNNTIPATIYTSFNNLNVTGGTTTLAANLAVTGTLSQSGGNMAVGAFTLTVNGTHSAGTNTVSGAGGYTLASGATLQSGSATGINGNITTTTKTLNTAANYTFNGSSAQVTGAAMPATVNNLIVSNAAGVTLSQNTATSGTLAVTSGTFTIGAFTYSVTGATTVSGTLSLTSATGTKTFTGKVTINNGGTWNGSANEDVSFGGSLQNDGTFTAGTGVHTFTGTAQTISGANAVSIPNLTISGTTTNNGSLTVSTTLAGASTLTNGATGTLDFGGSSITPTLVATATGNSVIFSRSTAQTVSNNNYYHLTLSGSSKILQTGTTAIGGNLTFSGTATATTVVGLVITGNLTVGNGTMYTLGGFDHTVTGTTSITGGVLITSTTGTKIFTGNVTINNGGFWNETASEDISFGGSLQNDWTFTTGTGVHTFTGAAQTISGANVVSIANVTISGTTTNNGTLTVSTLTISGTATNNGTLNVSTTVAGSGTLNNGTTGTLNFAGSSISPTLVATAAGNVINYTLAGAQTVIATTYHHLTLSGSGAKTTTGITVNGTLSMQGTATASAAPTYGASGTLEYKGSAVQAEGPELLATMPLGTTVIINNASGVTLGADTTLNGALTFTNGTFSTGSNTLYIGSTGTVSRTSGHVFGNFKKFIATGNTSKTFEVGGPSNYTPVLVSFIGVTTGGDLTAVAGVTDHANIASSQINAALSVNRTWTLTNSGIVFTTYDATFTFVAANLDAGVTTSAVIVGKYSGSAWTYPTVGTRTSTSTKVTGLTSFSDFQIGMLQTYSVGGYVRNAGSVGIIGVTITLSGSQSGTATTDVAGLYSFPTLPANGSYTFTPSKAGYVFAPANLMYTNLAASQAATNFTGTPVYTISGHILDAGGSPMYHVDVALGGDLTRTVSTDATGTYQFFLVPSGNYTVTPTSTGYAFAPLSLTYTSLSANQTQANFTATMYAVITGHVLDGGGGSIVGATMTLSGSQTGSTSTDANGFYYFNQLASGGNYTVTPSKTGYNFTSTSLTYNNVIVDQTGADFTGALITYTISGHMQNASGSAISSVTVTLSGGQAGSTSTDVNGAYSFASLPYGNNYTVTPTKTNYTFNAPSLTYNTLSANQPAADSTGISTVTYNIGGHIQNISGYAIVGAAVTLSGGQAGSTTTDASGNYSFTGLPSTNNYTVTPSLANYTFTPAPITYTSLSSNQTAADFAGNGVYPGSAGFSGVQGPIWYYRDSTGALMTWVPASNWWIGAEEFNIIWSNGAHPGENADAVRQWKAPATGSIRITGNALDDNPASGDGVVVSILKGTELLFLETIVNGNSTGFSFDKTTFVVAGDEINFVVNKRANNSADSTTFNPSITYLSYSKAITGHIQNGSGAAISGVTVTLSGGQTGSTTTNASGNYSFADLASGGNYTVTPSKIGYTFTSASLTYNNLITDQTAADFTGTLNTYDITGHIQNGSGSPISGVTVSLTGAQTASTTTDASGNYSFTSLLGSGNYTLTPSKTNYTFNSTSRTYNNLGVNQTSANFTAYAQTDPAPPSPFNVALASNGGVATASSSSASYPTSSSNDGERKGLNWGSGGGWSDNTSAVFPDWLQIDFNGSKTIDEIDVFTVQDSYASPSTPTQAMTFSLYGITDFQVQYWTGSAWAVVPGGNITGNNLVWQKLIFSPVSTTKIRVTVSNGLYDQSRITELEAYGAATTISGHIQTAGSVAISGVTVTLSGSQTGTRTTDASGNYSFADVLAGGNYTVTPTKTSYTFSSASRTYNNLSSNQTAADFTGTLVTYNISGHIQNASAVAINGVTVTLSGGQAGTTTTDSSGNYSFTVPSTNNYTVTPSLTNYTFSSTSLTYNNLSANQTTADFTGTSTVTYTISGHIQNASAIAINGVTVTLSGGQSGTTTTDSSGNYSFASLSATNNYTVTPSKTNYTFDPADVTYEYLEEDQTGVSFIGTSTITYTISGHIQDASGTAISGGTVALSGGQGGSTSTDASGNYSFMNLPSTNNYTLTASKLGYTLDPVSLTFNNLSANQTTANFTGNMLFISGHIQNASGVGISGVTVALSQSQTGTTTTDSSGNYSFANLPVGGTYRVTPSKAGYTFTPANRFFPGMSSSHSAADFIGLALASDPNVTLTASVIAAEGTQPGAELAYTINFTNDGAGPASAFVITDPIPVHTDFKLGSATTSLGTTSLTSTVTYSSNSGDTWTYTPTSTAGGAPAGYDRLVTHVRWTFTGNLPAASPNNAGSVGLTTRIP